MKWVLKGCPACGGDLQEQLEDDGCLTCFMCARTFSSPDARDGRPAYGHESGEARFSLGEP